MTFIDSPKRKRPGQPRILRWILANIPTGDVSWRESQARLGSSNAARYTAIIRSFLDPHVVPSVSVGDAKRSNSGNEKCTIGIVDLIRHFSKCAELSSEDAALHRARASFQRLILLSLCTILRARGSTNREIHGIISWFSPVERTREKCLRGISWVHKAICALHHQHDWTLERATELFFLIPLSVSRLGELAVIDIADFAARVPNFAHRTCLTPHFTFPTLILELLKQYNSPAETLNHFRICNILGYTAINSTYEERIDAVSSPALELQIEISCPGTYNASERASSAETTQHVAPKRSGASSEGYDCKRQCRRQKEDSLADSHASPSCMGTLRGIKTTTDLITNSPSSSLPALAEIAIHDSGSRDASGIQSSNPYALLSLFNAPPAISFSHEQLMRGTVPQRRWDEGGNIQDICLEEAGIDKDLANIFRDSFTLHCAIQSLKSRGALLEGLDETGQPVYTLNAALDGGKMRTENCFAGLIYICHIYPQEEALDPDFHVMAKKLLPPLSLWFAYLRQMEFPDLSARIREHLIEAWAAISRLQSTLDSSPALWVTDQLYADDLPDRLRLLRAKAHSELLRRNGVDHLAKSDRVLHDALQMCPLTPEINDKRTRCLVKQLHLSLIKNAIAGRDFDAALSMWSQLDAAPQEQARWSELEFQIELQRLTQLGLVFRYKGKVEEAKHVFDRCSYICETHAGLAHPHHITRHRAELLCELGRPEEALSLLQRALTEHGAKWNITNSRPYRRLCLARAEALSLTTHHGEASALLDEVAACFEHEAPQTASDKLDHVRVGMGQMWQARHRGYLLEALQHATRTLDLLDCYRSLGDLDYYKSVTRQFRAAVCFALARGDLEVVQGCDPDAQFLIVGMATYKREEILRELDMFMRLVR